MAGLVANVRLCALWEVVGPEPSAAYRLRRIFRWYSREFSVPLPEVSKLPLAEVLRDYFECEYERLQDDGKYEELERERVELTESDAERVSRLAAEAAEDAADDDFAAEAEAEEAAKDSKLGLPVLIPPTPEPEPAFDAVPSTDFKDAFQGALPDGIEMTFADHEDDDGPDEPLDLP